MLLRSVVIPGCYLVLVRAVSAAGRLGCHDGGHGFSTGLLVPLAFCFLVHFGTPILQPLVRGSPLEDGAVCA